MDEAAWKAFGEWVEQLRVRSGLQVGEVAERAGVSRVWLQEIRNGGRGVPGGWRLPNPKNESLVRLARVLNVPPRQCLLVPDKARHQAPLRRRPGGRRRRGRAHP